MTHRLLKIVLWILCVYHLGIGAVSLLAPETTVELGQVLYGLQVDGSAAQFAYMLKALGMYALFTGGLLALTLTDPARYRHILIAVAFLLLMRATTRVLFFDTLHEAFGVTWGRNLFNVLFMLTKATILFASAHALQTAEGEAPEPTRENRAPAPQRLIPQRSMFASASGIR